jgi:RecJ-like exonuclease
MKYLSYEQWNELELERRRDDDTEVACPACNGDGESYCPCCGFDNRCADCDGTGRIPLCDLIELGGYRFPRHEYLNAIAATIKKLCEWDRSRDFWDEIGEFFHQCDPY